MIQIIIDANKVELSQDDFLKDSTIYILRGDHKIKNQIILPTGSELRIEYGTLTYGALNSKSHQNGIFLLCSDQTISQKEKENGITKYTVLSLTSSTERVDVYDEKNEIYTTQYLQTDTVFMRAGDYIKNIGPDNFEMRLTANCRILLPHNTSSANLHILSDKVNTIQIDGKCEFQLHAENCKFERIFDSPEGMVLIHRVYVDDGIYNEDNNTTTYPSGGDGFSLFENCEIFAENYNSHLTPPFSNFLSIWTNVSNKSNTTSDAATFDIVYPKILDLDIINRLIMHDCVVTNVGLTGTVSVDNCTFLFGQNVNNNYETIHCSNHSRITNCIFDGRENVTGIPPLTHDVIDTFNGHDIIITGCTFKAYSSPINEEGEKDTGHNIITVKSHYYSGTPKPDDQQQISNFIGPQNGVIIRNCFFDLPTFTGSAVVVWNGPIDSAVQKRSLNRQFTLIEGNYMEMPKATAFVNCLQFSDYVTVRNNVGCVNNTLVNVPEKANDPKHSDLNYDEKSNNKAYNIIIEGNILRYQKYTKDEVPIEMKILTGTYIENLILENNTVVGCLWSMWPGDFGECLTGTTRVVNNESIGDSLFRARTAANAHMPNGVNTFFSGNVSDGKKTDTGNCKMQESLADGLFFNGRKFFNIETNKCCIYYNKKWYYRTYKFIYIEPTS